MSKIVLDASAILAAIFEEDGSERVKSLLENSLVSTVNIAEVLSTLSEKGFPLSKAFDDLQKLGMEMVDFDLEHAAKAAELRSINKHLGLSLGDRSCLALAIVKKTTAVTADREWSKISICPVELIR